jgi:GNAT superfamily N-acetyltransferase
MIEIREAVFGDIPAIFSVRIAVRENPASMEWLRELGITPKSVANDMNSSSKGWVADNRGQVVGFSIADKVTKSIERLFVLPEHERRDLGRALLQSAVDWLRESGVDRVWLTAGESTRAAGFYRHLGWRATGLTPQGEMRFELDLQAG